MCERQIERYKKNGVSGYHLFAWDDSSLFIPSGQKRISFCEKECEVDPGDDPVVGENHKIPGDPLAYGLICSKCYTLWKVWRIING